MIFLLIVFGVAAMAFGAWGVDTKAGQKRFVEMDGIYPWLIGIVGCIFVIAAVVLLVFSWIQSGN